MFGQGDDQTDCPDDRGVCTYSKHCAMAFSFYRDLRRELDFCEARGGARAPLSKA